MDTVTEGLGVRLCASGWETVLPGAGASPTRLLLSSRTSLSPNCISPRPQCQGMALPAGAALPTAPVRIQLCKRRLQIHPSKPRNAGFLQNTGSRSQEGPDESPGESEISSQRVSHSSEGQAYGEITALLGQSLHAAWSSREEKRKFSKKRR